MGSELGPCGSEGIVESPRKGSKAQFASALKPSLAFVKAELNFYEYIQQTLKNIHKKDAHYIKKAGNFFLVSLQISFVS